MLDDFVKDFLIECQEGLAQFEESLIALEREPGSTMLLSSIFRVIHSIKGAAGLLGFPKMVSVTHEGEELLGKLRAGELATTPAIVSGLLGLIDLIRSIAESIEAGRGERESAEDAVTIALLRSLQHAPTLSPDPPSIPAPSTTGLARIGPEDDGPVVGDLDLPARVEPATIRIGRDRDRDELAEPAVASALVEGTIRVDVELLDRLMNLVGELVLTRNQLLRATVRVDPVLQACSQRLNLITTELQEGMMKTRMQPIRVLTSKLPRVVRDLAIACGKEASILLEGEETELDKTLGEAIKDPITHIIRNGVDHGIESPMNRLAAGKPRAGRLRLRAYHEGGMVNIEVSDDGSGIDPVRLREKAVERGWLDEDEATTWTDRDLIGLIFRPGFSTAETTTTVSGRGVGMDVVKSRIESIGGSVDASSRVGEGTTIKMRIPLTLTIINALIVAAGDDRFAIPQVNLVELVRLHEGHSGDLIALDEAMVFRYRGRLLPLLDLNTILKRPDSRDGREGVKNLVVLQADRRRFGLLVDGVDDAQEIVVRPLARQLKGIDGLAGATIMGDGRIALILDVFGLAKGLDGRHDGDEDLRDSSLAIGGDDRESSRPMVVLGGTDGGQFALPLAEVERLESIPRDAVEWVAGRPLVAYRQALLPLIDVAAVLRGEVWNGGLADRDEAESSGGRPWNVVIHVRSGRRFGLLFDRIVDVIDARLDVAGEGSRPGVLLTAVIAGRATEILDVAAILEFWAEATPTASSFSLARAEVGP